MKDRTIENSRRRIIALGKYLEKTFRTLRISDTKVIKSCHVGRGTYYKVKNGIQVNADAYLRLRDFALDKIRERARGRHPPQITEEDWKEQCRKIIAGG